MSVVLPRAPFLATELCELIARFLAPRLRRGSVHPVARLAKALLLHVELPRCLVVFRRWEHRPCGLAERWRRDRSLRNDARKKNLLGLMC